MAINTVIDLSHHNASPNFVQAAAGGITGVLHKATEGLGFVDPDYAVRRTAAQAAGLMWGAYHFGTGDDPVAQADHFLQTVGPDNAGMLLVLDFEQNPNGSSMNLDQARAFVTRISDQAGRWPGLYSGNYVKELLGNEKDPVLSLCWFWLAQYGSTATVPPNWSGWTLWQYTDGVNGPQPHAAPGIGPCDRDQYFGEADALRVFWLNGGA
ncbi:glycoside hydrolase family 25 protein [Caulobacter sp. CCG-8]|uniref:glycoside hydrolase family 25 protein n=1 Tax=Caulobacter sp. CCG-8 TaxID=3127958 RepID=UPI00307E2F0C